MASTGNSPRQRSVKFAILQHREFRYYWIGTIFSNVGEHIENVIRNWLIWELTHSVFWLMVMVFMHWMPMRSLEALLATAGAFATNAITLSAAAATVALLTFGFVFFVPGVSKQR
jgi:hypothetical protein